MDREKEVSLGRHAIYRIQNIQKKLRSKGECSSIPPATHHTPGWVQQGGGTPPLLIISTRISKQKLHNQPEENP
jgi:hypothetical protein